MKKKIDETRLIEFNFFCCMTSKRNEQTGLDTEE